MTEKMMSRKGSGMLVLLLIIFLYIAAIMGCMAVAPVMGMVYGTGIFYIASALLAICLS